MDSTRLKEWLETDTVQASERYQHTRLVERADRRAAVLDDLRAFWRAAHADAKEYIRFALGYDTLDPLADPNADPAADFPAVLDLLTLQGYFGEVLAGLIAEYFEPHGEANWRVPAYLFRGHLAAFHQFERTRQDEPANRSMGRPGNDCLAFTLDEDGDVAQALVCEAKCTLDHDAGLIADAHQQISDANYRPVDVMQLVHVLADSKSPHAQVWVRALRRYLNQRPPTVPRFDLVVYVCGRRPVASADGCWIDRASPHARYTASRHLQATEVHLVDVEQLIRDVYGKSR